ncbi:hypothetical protein Q7P37_004820 [Cladosporium fusiforme]
MTERNDSPVQQHQDEQAGTVGDRESLAVDDFPQSLLLIPAGLEVVPDSGKEPVQPEKEAVQAEKEAISQEEKESVKPVIEPDGWHAIWRGPKMSRRICGMKASRFIASLITIVVIFALGIGLGVGLHDAASEQKDDPSTSGLASSSLTAVGTSPTSAEYRIGGSIDASYYSRQGAWNGSGFALAAQTFPKYVKDAPKGNLVLYFQHNTGEIRWIRLSTRGDWIGGSRSEIVAADAKNSTPISAVSYVRNATSIWHIFYIDVNNRIRQRSNSNRTDVWTNGLINDMAFIAYAADLVGMQACWAGRSSLKGEYGMRIWIATNSTTFTEYLWYEGEETWSQQREWIGYNGAAGVGCYSWGEDERSYVALVTTRNNVELWYRDQTNENEGSTQGYIQSMTYSHKSMPRALLAYTNFLYAQMVEPLRLQAYNISWSGNATEIVHNDTFSLPSDQGPGLSGTHFAVTSLPNQSGGNSHVVFIQTNGSDITEYVRDLEGGRWSRVNISIPDE